ncbi:hypothetical protein [Pseudactinotalea terrae]|uniref:hypothetical protein n=1 Tax=Pseudactinotalea terrae TaxID=1743262 RepID=UPI0012E28ECD|nr:hypothetical protein [Pseudactinotalea terrae]
MAYLESLSALDPLDRGRPHSVSDATWRVATREGLRVLQIDTYGSPERKDKGTVSQSIQLDATKAAELVAICRSVFPEIG